MLNSKKISFSLTLIILLICLFMASNFAYTAVEAATSKTSKDTSNVSNATTKKLSQEAPLAPTATKITTKSVVLTSSTGARITCNGQTKASGSIWVGLKPGTTYTAYAYYKEDTTHNQSTNSANCSFSTLKLNQTPPVVPTAIKITSNSAKLTSSTGARITCNNQTKASGSVWTGLKPGTTYTAYAYYKEDATHNQSSNSENYSFNTSKINQTVPTVPVASNITSNSVILTSSVGSRIVCNGQVKASGSAWTGLNAVTTYTAYAYFPSDATHNRSSSSAKISFDTLKMDQAAPKIPTVLSITSNSVILTSNTGTQITCNNQTKASGSTWTDLSPAAEYTAYAYLPGDAEHNQSPNSEICNFTTLKLEQAAPEAPVVSNITTESAILTSSVGAQITCNNQTKASGSTWMGLSENTTYTAHAYFPADETHYLSLNSDTINFKTKVAPKLDTPTLQGAINMGEDGIISATGANINQASYRIFYTTEVSSPSVTSDTNPDTLPGNGWIDSGISSNMNITDDGTNISQNVLNSNLKDANWTYVLFKAAAVSIDDIWIAKYSPAYSLGSDVNSYINYVGYNQIINIEKTGEKIVLSSPKTQVQMYGPYNASESDINENSVFYDKQKLTYRFEFDVLKPSQISDIKVSLDYNIFNVDGVKFQPNVMYLQKRLANGSFSNMKIFGAPDSKEIYKFEKDGNGSNRYSLKLGNNSEGSSIIASDTNPARYAIEYSGDLLVDSKINTETLIRNEAEVSIYSQGRKYPETLEMERPNKKFYVDTKVCNTKAVN